MHHHVWIFRLCTIMCGYSGYAPSCVDIQVMHHHVWIFRLCTIMCGYSGYAPSCVDIQVMHHHVWIFRLCTIMCGYSDYTPSCVDMSVMPATCITSRFRTCLGGAAFGPPTFFTILTDSGVLTGRAVPKRVGCRNAWYNRHNTHSDYTSSCVDIQIIHHHVWIFRLYTIMCGYSDYTPSCVDIQIIHHHVWIFRLYTIMCGYSDIHHHVWIFRVPEQNNTNDELVPALGVLCIFLRLWRTWVTVARFVEKSVL